MNSEKYEGQHNHNGIMYNIFATIDVHERLLNGMYCNFYL